MGWWISTSPFSLIEQEILVQHFREKCWILESKTIKTDLRAVYYSVLNAWLDQQDIHVGANRLVGIRALDCVEWYCLKHDWPDLTALVVHKDPRPENRHSGDGFLRPTRFPWLIEQTCTNIGCASPGKSLTTRQRTPFNRRPTCVAMGIAHPNRSLQRVRRTVDLKPIERTGRPYSLYGLHGVGLRLEVSNFQVAASPLGAVRVSYP